jgi:cytochrome P450
MYGASIDTTITTVMHFIRVMALYPHVQRKLQVELDAVLTIDGRTRLPAFADREKLPYLEHVLSETLRWSSSVPSGLPHRLQVDDIYAPSSGSQSYFIPKGAFVFANIWAMLRDENIYPNADEFWPERFEVEVDEREKKRRDPRNYVFGFGRRHCPGAHLIESSAWLLIASICATLNISKAVGEDGKEIEPELIVQNAVFRCASFSSD